VETFGAKEVDLFTLIEEGWVEPEEE